MSLCWPCPGHLSLPPANSGPRRLLQPRLFLFTAVLGNDFSGPRRRELAGSSWGSLLLLRVGGVRGLFSHPAGRRVSLRERFRGREGWDPGGQTLLNPSLHVFRVSC